jgi:hypothetical protein
VKPKLKDGDSIHFFIRSQWQVAPQDDTIYGNQLDTGPLQPKHAIAIIYQQGDNPKG